MLQAIKNLFGEEKLNSEELHQAIAWKQATSGRDFFKPLGCPYARYVLQHGVPVVRMFHGTRNDN